MLVMIDQLGLQTHNMEGREIDLVILKSSFHCADLEFASVPHPHASISEHVSESSTYYPHGILCNYAAADLQRSAHLNVEGKVIADRKLTRGVTSCQQPQSVLLTKCQDLVPPQFIGKVEWKARLMA